MESTVLLAIVSLALLVLLVKQVHVEPTLNMQRKSTYFCKKYQFWGLLGIFGHDFVNEPFKSQRLIEYENENVIEY